LTKKIKLVISLLIIILTLISVNSVIARPSLPASYYGTITLDNVAINSGEVFSCIDSEEINQVLIYDGEYGVKNNLRLSAVATDEDKIVHFCYNNLIADQTIEWNSGDIVNLNLTFSSSDNGGSSGGTTGGGSQPESNEDNISDNINDEIPQVIIDESSFDNEIEETIIAEKGKTLSFQFKKSQINNIKILFNQNVENPIITIKTYNIKPNEIEKISTKNKIYKYFSIEKNFDETNIKSTTINFEVKVSWFADNNYKPEDIILLHFKDNKWVELPTKLTGLTKDSYIFESQTNSFSYFAITIKEKSNTPSYIIILVVIILIIGIVFYLNKLKSKNKKRKIKK